MSGWGKDETKRADNNVGIKLGGDFEPHLSFICYNLLMNKVRVRFAPSPTGLLHIGGARTALFNYLFAKRKKGKLILRIEDTDKARSKKVFEHDILNSLKWLGLDWDELYYQSKRSKLYKKYLEKLLADDRAYWDDGAIRFRIGAKHTIVFNDEIRGEVKIESDQFEDFVIAKSLDVPLFLFVNVVDDTEMKISHIIRGEDHLTNTARQIMIYNALSFEYPVFAHLPLMLNSDRSKMSKRVGDTALGDYIAAGYLPEAMINFLVQMGWSSASGEEILTLEELIQEFSLKRVQKAGAIFDVKYLEYFNGHYLREKSLSEYLKLAEPFLPKTYSKDKAYLKKALKTVQERVRRLGNVKELIDFYFVTPKLIKSKIVFRNSSLVDTRIGLEKSIEALSSLKSWTEKSVQKILEKVVKSESLSNGDIFWPIRYILSGADASPSPVELLSVLGQKESLKRLKKGLETIKRP